MSSGGASAAQVDPLTVEMLLTLPDRKTSTERDLSHFLFSRARPRSAWTMPLKAALTTRHSQRWSECRGNWALLSGLYLTFQRRDLKVGQGNLLEEQQLAWLDEEEPPRAGGRGGWKREGWWGGERAHSWHCHVVISHSRVAASLAPK